MKNYIIILIVLILASCNAQKNVVEEPEILKSTPSEINKQLEIVFNKGKEHNYPSFAIWIEDEEGNYIETLFVTQYVATGKFGRGEIEPGKWKNEPGDVRRPATLPYWAHKRNIKADDGLYVPSPETKVPDALSGATPKGSFILETGTKVRDGKFKILLEINQAWDSNRFWTNSKFPGDKDYFASLQPALVYAADIDLSALENQYLMDIIGHSHHSGKDGKLYTDTSNHTTAKEIASEVLVSLK